ncbi:hypothetical protein [Bradyrhizobium sp. S3.2.12]|uniref:hypothetical protein n=1 Tax=Bradyrhizobium sp. S3.2.12 TaxID=3156387 RepID=UPI0033957B29
MNTNNQPLATAKGTSTLARAKFGSGMLLQHDDLEQLNVYTRELNRLMFRSLFGCGVVCGLVVGTEVACGKVNVTVGSGLALDCQGDPIYVPKPQSIVLDEQCKPDIPTPLWVVLCGTEKCCAPRTSMCASDEDETTSVCTRERDGFEIRIVRTRPKCTCSCPEPNPKDRTQSLLDDACKCVNPEQECYVDHYAGKCGCDCEDCAQCDCDCVLLARLDRSGDHDRPVWTPDHRVRRFVRPVLMRDPQVEKEQRQKEQVEKDQEQADTKPEPETPAPAKKSAAKR